MGGINEQSATAKPPPLMSCRRLAATYIASEIKRSAA
jgi:hypothetical protein